MFYGANAPIGLIWRPGSETIPNQSYWIDMNWLYFLMIVHLIDGTYELFRHFYGQRSFNKGKDKPFGGVAGVLNGVLQMINDGATHIGVATDHVIESFRNDLWPGYKTGYGIDPALWKQFHPLEEALSLMGVVVWPMTDLEADDALASAAYLAAKDKKVQKVCIWTPDKDLAQCVLEDRVVQIDGKAKIIRDEEAIRKKFGVSPKHIPDYLALVGDAADGYPGISGIGKVTAVRLINEFGSLESFPEKVLGDRHTDALLFKQLATLRTDAKLFRKVDELKWQGPTKDFAVFARKIGEEKLIAKAEAVLGKVRQL